MYNIGTMVIFNNTGQFYNSYTSFFDRRKFHKYKSKYGLFYPEVDQVFTIVDLCVDISAEFAGYNGYIYVLEDFRGNIYLNSMSDSTYFEIINFSYTIGQRVVFIDDSSFFDSKSNYDQYSNKTINKYVIGTVLEIIDCAANPNNHDVVYILLDKNDNMYLHEMKNPHEYILI